MPTCLLVRHGHSSANGQGVLAGWTPDVALTDQGREQVAALAERLRDVPVVLVVTSPLLRCRQTAQALGAGTAEGQPPVLEEPELGECHYGEWTGRSIKDLAEDPLWRTVQDNPSAARFPDSETYAGESLSAMAHRGVSAVRRHDQRVEEEHGAGAVWVAVSHGDVIKAVLADAAGSHLDQFQRFVAEPASVSVVRYTAKRPFLVCSNDIGGDLARFRPPPEAEAPDGDAVVGGGSHGAAS